MGFNLYKNRGFSENFADTFLFFKLYGKHYFKNYVLINGLFLIVIFIALYYLENGFSYISGRVAYATEFTENNITTVDSTHPVVLWILLFVVSFFYLIISFSFPSLYMKLIDDKEGTNFDTIDLVQAIRSSLRRVVGFFLLLCFVSVLIFSFFFASVIILTAEVLQIVSWFGFIMLFIVILFMSSLISFFLLAFNLCLINKTDYFDSLHNSAIIIKSNFSSILWSTVVMVLIISALLYSVIILPEILAITVFFTTAEINEYYKLTQSFPLNILLPLFVFIINIFLFSFLLINQSIIYFSSSVDPNKKMIKQEIEEIGVN